MRKELCLIALFILAGCHPSENVQESEQKPLVLPRVDRKTRDLLISENMRHLAPLVDKHPDPLVYEYLPKLILEHRIEVNFNPNPTDNVFARVFYSDRPGLEGIWLDIQSDMLRSDKVSLSLKRAILYHEMVHLKQYFDGRISRDSMNFDRETLLSASEKEMWFLAEVEAYRKTCLYMMIYDLENAEVAHYCEDYYKIGEPAIRNGFATAACNLQPENCQFYQNVAATTKQLPDKN